MRSIAKYVSIGWLNCYAVKPKGILSCAIVRESSIKVQSIYPRLEISPSRTGPQERLLVSVLDLRPRDKLESLVAVGPLLPVVHQPKQVQPLPAVHAARFRMRNE